MVLNFDPFQLSTSHIFYACLGGFVVFFGMVSLFIREKLYIGEALLGFVFGVIIGPYGANVLDPHDWAGGSEVINDIITLEFTRVVLAIGVFAIGVELPKAYMQKHWKSLAFLVGPVMTWGWFVSAGLIYAFIPGLNFLSCLAIAACLTPTDPILAAAVVGGKWADKHVPAHLRHLLAAESGCNDGAAFPFLFISLYLLLDRNVGESIRDWFLFLWLYQIILGIIIGAFLGFGFRHLMKTCQRRNLIDRQAYVAQYISLAMLTLGVTTLLGSDDVLACFVCGVTFAWDGFFNKQTEEAVFSSVIDLLFNVTAFVYIGAWMPFNAFQDVHTPLRVWRLVALAVLVLLLRRLPIIIGLYKWIPDIKTFPEAVFSGHFGPIGVGAIFISTLAVEVIHKDKYPKTEQIILLEQLIQPIVAFMVLCSVAIHGLSIPGFSLGRRVRTVSRTWSRHTSVPDWTTQLKVVDRGADIVINRDSIMEQGGLSGKGIEAETLTLNEKRPEDDVDLPNEKAEVVTTWKEPHYTVVERQRGPGDDVVVEVVHDQRSRNPGITTGIRHSLHLLDGLRKSTGQLEDSIGHSVENQIAAIEAHMNQILSNPEMLRRAEAEDGKLTEADDGDDDDDDDWASDDETPDAVDDDRKSRSREPKMRQAKTHIHHVHHHHHHQHQHSLGSARRTRRRSSGPIESRPVSPVPEDPRQPLTRTIRTSVSAPLSTEPEPESPSRAYHYQRRQASSLASTSASGSSTLFLTRSPTATAPSTRPHTADGPAPSSSSRPATRPNTSDGRPSVTVSTRPTSRPNTSDGPRAGYSRPNTRPTTADSAYSRRVEHLRTIHSSPPTRDSSPSRLIRFKDEAGAGVGAGGRTPPEEDTEGKRTSGGTGRFPRSSTIQ